MRETEENENNDEATKNTPNDPSCRIRRRTIRIPVSNIKSDHHRDKIEESDKGKRGNNNKSRASKQEQKRGKGEEESHYSIPFGACKRK
jgi:hypothetical protein